MIYCNSKHLHYDNPIKLSGALQGELTFHYGAFDNHSLSTHVFFLHYVKSPTLQLEPMVGI